MGQWIPSVLRRGRGGVLLILACFCLLGAWALSSPPQSAPDDDFQLASIWCAGESPATGMCSQSTVPYNEFGVVKREVPADIGGAPCFRSRATKSAACLGRASSSLIPARTNAGLYPRPFFSVLHWFAGSDVARSVLLMRLFNLTLALVMFGAAFAVAERGLRASAALTWAIVLVPTGAFFIPSTNATSWAIIGIATLPVFLLQFLRGRTRVRMGLAAVGATAALLLATSARSDAAAFGGAAVLACVLFTLLADGLRARWRLAAVGALILWAAVLFLQSHIATSVASNGMGSAFAGMTAPSTSSLTGLTLWLSNLYALPGLIAGSFGAGWGLGWLDTMMPTIVGVIGCAVVAAVVLRGWVGGGRPARWTFAFVVMVLVAVPLQILQTSHSFVGNLVQARYLYPLLIVAVLVAVSGGPVEGPVSFAFTRRQYLAIAGALALANAYALHTNIERYASGLAQEGIDPGYGHGWWWSGSPINPLWLWLVGSVAGASALTGLVAVAARATGTPLIGAPRPTYRPVAARLADMRASARVRRQRRAVAHLMPVPGGNAPQDSGDDSAPQPEAHPAPGIAPEPVAREVDTTGIRPRAHLPGPVIRRAEARRAPGSPRFGAPLKGEGRRRRD